MQLQGTALDDCVIKSKLKERSYLTETYYKCSKRKPDVKKLIVKTNECVEIISAVKEDKLFKCLKN